jgi:hypothetical protein
MTRVSSFIAVEAILELSVAARSRVKFCEKELMRLTTRRERNEKIIIVTMSSASEIPASAS